MVGLVEAGVQGRTLVHFSTQRTRFLWDKGVPSEVVYRWGGRVAGWVGDFHIWGPGIRPNPSESDSLPNPSESGTHFSRVKCPYRLHNKNALRGCSESARIRPNPTLHRIRPNPEPPSQVAGVTGCYGAFGMIFCQKRLRLS